LIVLNTPVDAAPAGISRKHYSKEFKQRLVCQSLAPGVSAAKIALKHQINANLLFKWRRRYLREISSPAAEAVKLLPVTIREKAEEPPPVKAVKDPRSLHAVSRCTVEIELPEGRLVVKGDIPIELLRSVVQIVRSR
jgi:transposase